MTEWDIKMTVKMTIPLVDKLFACVDCKYYDGKHGESWCTRKNPPVPVSEVGLGCKPKKSWKKK